MKMVVIRVLVKTKVLFLTRCRETLHLLRITILWEVTFQEWIWTIVAIIILTIRCFLKAKVLVLFNHQVPIILINHNLFQVPFLLSEEVVLVKDMGVHTLLLQVINLIQSLLSTSISIPTNLNLLIQWILICTHPTYKCHLLNLQCLNQWLVHQWRNITSNTSNLISHIKLSLNTISLHWTWTKAIWRAIIANLFQRRNRLRNNRKHHLIKTFTYNKNSI